MSGWFTLRTLAYQQEAEFYRKWHDVSRNKQSRVDFYGSWRQSDLLSGGAEVVWADEASDLFGPPEEWDGFFTRKGDYFQLLRPRKSLPPHRLAYLTRARRGPFG
jgi:hypothetical protein